MNKQDQLQSLNALYWTLQNGIVTENRKPLEFKQHRYLREPYMVWDSRVVSMKASQVGWSTLAILRSIHLAAKRGANVVYVLPTRKLSEEFLIPKFNPIVDNNKVIQDLIGETDQVSLKKIGERYIYFRGAYKDTEAIAISVDAVIADEYDRADQKVLKMYRTRLDNADPDLRFEWIFSNPSVPGNGVDTYWQRSDKRHWLVTCSKGHSLPLEWPDSINLEKAYYWCSQCHTRLSDEDRNMGQWVAKYPGKDWTGYWVSQLMVPNKPASEMIEKYETQEPDLFHNFTLGLPYLNKDTQISPQDIIDICIPGKGSSIHSAMGVDVGKIKHYMIGNEHGIYLIGQTEDWDEIERLMIANKVKVCVIDSMPDITIPKRLAKKYPGKVFTATYVNTQKSLEITRVSDKDPGTILIDRTKAFDQLMADIRNKDVIINYDAKDPKVSSDKRGQEGIINHFNNIYRISEDSKLGPVSRWTHLEGKPDHYPHTMVYQRAALAKVIGGYGVITKPLPPKKETNPTIDIVTGTIPGVDIRKAARLSGRMKR